MLVERNQWLSYSTNRQRVAQLWNKKKINQSIFIVQESESDSENEANQDEGYQEPEKPVILVDNDPDRSNKQALKRRVSFAAVACDEQSSNEIRYDFLAIASSEMLWLLNHLVLTWCS